MGRCLPLNSILSRRPVKRHNSSINRSSGSSSSSSSSSRPVEAASTGGDISEAGGGACVGSETPSFPIRPHRPPPRQALQEATTEQVMAASAAATSAVTTEEQGCTNTTTGSYSSSDVTKERGAEEGAPSVTFTLIRCRSLLLAIPCALPRPAGMLLLPGSGDGYGDQQSSSSSSLSAAVTCDGRANVGGGSGGSRYEHCYGSWSDIAASAEKFSSYLLTSVLRGKAVPVVGAAVARSTA